MEEPAREKRFHRILARKSNRFLVLMCVLGATFLATVGETAWREQGDSGVLARESKLAARLELTDLCLFTEARYTRHPSQADFDSAFQDYPGALDHFPSGSLIAPPHLPFGPDESIYR